MSADIAMSIMPAACDCAAAADVANGATARPAVTKTARMRLTSRRKSIGQHSTGGGTLEDHRLHMFARGSPPAGQAQHDPAPAFPDFCAWMGGHGADP